MACERRLIDASQLVKNVCKLDRFYFTAETDIHLHDCEMVELAAVLAEIDELDTEDAVDVVHGQWEHENCDIFHCSACGYVDVFPHMDDGVRPHKYCPNCGAKMDGGADNGI